MRHWHQAAFVACSLCTMACSGTTSNTAVDAGTAPADAGISAAPLDVEVILHIHGDDAYVFGYIAERNRPCSCVNAWPTMDVCEPQTDVLSCDCSPEPGACVTAVRAEREGQTVVEAVPHFLDQFGLSIPGLVTSVSDTVLVIEGCGGEMRIPLPRERMPPPQVERISFDNDSLHLEWTEAGTGTGVVGSIGGGYSGTRCMSTFSSPTTLPRWSGDSFATLWTLDAREPTETPLGTVRLSRSSLASASGIFYSQQMLDGRWGLPDGLRREAATTSIDGNITQTKDLHILAASVELSAPNVNHTIKIDGRLVWKEIVGPNAVMYHSDSFSFAAGPLTDVLRFRIEDDKWYRAEFPHVAPEDGLDVGRFATETYILDLSAIELVNEADSADRQTLSFRLEWQLGVFAEPLAL